MKRFCRTLFNQINRLPVASWLSAQLLENYVVVVHNNWNNCCSSRRENQIGNAV